MVRFIIICFLLAGALLSQATGVDNHSERVHFSGQLDFDDETIDSLTLIVWDGYVTMDQRFGRDSGRTMVIPVHQDGSFEFTPFTLNTQFAYFSLFTHTLRGRPIEILKLYRVEPGDRANIQIRHELRNGSRVYDADGGSNFCPSCLTVSFSGPAAQKLRCQLKLDQLSQTNVDAGADLETPYENPTVATHYKRFVKAMAVVADIKRVIGSYRSALSPAMHASLEIDFISDRLAWLYSTLVRSSAGIRRLDEGGLAQFDQFVQQLQGEQSLAVYGPELAASPFHVHLLAVQARFETVFRGVDDPIRYIRDHYDGDLAEPTLVSYILANYTAMPNWPQVVQMEIGQFTNPKYKEILSELLNKETVGESLAHFELLDQNGQTLRLGDTIAGKVVFIDFWYTGCAGCANYYKHIVSKVEADFQADSRVMFVSVSIDTNQAKWLNSIASNTYTNNEITNFRTSGGVSDRLIKQLNISSYPRPLVLDEQGNVFSNDYPTLRSYDGLRKVLNAAIEQKALARD